MATTLRPSQVRVHLARQRWRLRLVWVGLSLGVLGLGGRLVALQGVQANGLREQAAQQQKALIRQANPRRLVVDTQGAVLALDQPVYELYAHPRLFQKTAPQVAQALAPILERPVNTISQDLQRAPSGILLMRGLAPGVAQQIEQLHLDGLELVGGFARVYPQQRVGAELVGYVNREHRGQAGVELSQEALLQQPQIPAVLQRDGRGNYQSATMPTSWLLDDPRQLRLTLDVRLQRGAQEALQQSLRKFQAQRGAVIVLRVKDGAIRALVLEPGYDPNAFYRFPLERFKNWAVTDLYEPGSTFKPVNVAIALESQRVRPGQVFYDEGRIFVGGWPIQNFNFDQAGAGGSLSVSEILQYSSNVGMVHMMEQLPRQDYYQALRRLGLGEELTTDLPFTSPTTLKSQVEFVNYPVEAATAAFGQGLSLTPLKLAQLYAAIGNGGWLVTPHAVSGLWHPQTEELMPLKHPPPVRVFSQETSTALMPMLEQVVERGTGKPARIAGYRLGGKTGTAQKAGVGGYHSGKITSFVALFPMPRPEYVVLAVADEPRAGNAFGSTVTAPVVKAVIERLITLEGIPPSRK
ncbi:penicillin-binding protein [Gloeomargarita lithophora Alchichica-D10]|uniref:Penicillin-binding protein n=1 Tax=Gloeomargarita lithophora Alchichica-D10 TaxID=1188229 RepID=A0A1J0ACX3_9CYAN|nr:penicillin-binding protein 2 [Gloeomargarita lithophora]APB33790.1 penicillin-binding protein [Gloeomargarita lithophora Alchichica-D10]